MQMQLSFVSLYGIFFQHLRIYRGAHTYIGLLFCLFSVTTTREQVADAHALLDITKSLVVSAKGHSRDGLTPSAFVTRLIEKFGKRGGTSASRKDCNSIAWKDIGVAVSSVFGRGYGCYTM